VCVYYTAEDSGTSVAAAAGDDADIDDYGDAVDSTDRSEPSSYARLSSAAARLKSLALQLSERLSDAERFRIIEDISATFNIVLNSRPQRL